MASLSWRLFMSAYLCSWWRNDTKSLGCFMKKILSGWASILPVSVTSQWVEGIAMWRWTRRIILVPITFLIYKFRFSILFLLQNRDWWATFLLNFQYIFSEKQTGSVTNRFIIVFSMRCEFTFLCWFQNKSWEIYSVDIIFCWLPGNKSMPLWQ